MWLIGLVAKKEEGEMYMKFLSENTNEGYHLEYILVDRRLGYTGSTSFVFRR
jgi:hypothetical protein